LLSSVCDDDRFFRMLIFCVIYSNSCCAAFHCSRYI